MPYQTYFRNLYTVSIGIYIGTYIGIYIEYICRNIRKFLDTITSKDDIDDFELNVKMPVIDYLNELDEGLHVQ